MDNQAPASSEVIVSADKMVEVMNVRKAENATRKDSEKPSQQTRLQVRAYFAPASINEEDRTVDVIFGSDKPTRMWTWEYGLINEVLSFDAQHVRMDRLNSGAPMLDNHDAYGSVSDIVIGVVERAWTDKGMGHAKVRFSKTDKAQRTMEMVKDGILRNISVGYAVDKYQVTRATDGGLDLYKAVDWEPHEVSLVPVPADYTAKVRMQGDSRNIQIEYDAETLAEMRREAQEIEQKKQDEIINQRRLQAKALMARYPNK